jgi:hypothetical protein
MRRGKTRTLDVLRKHMSKETITLVAALIAAITSVGNVYFNYLSATSLEREKWQKAREDDAKKNLRLALADFSRELSTGVQRATWLLWIAENNPSAFSEKDLSTYDEEMRAILPRFLTARVVVAAHDMATYERLSELSNRLYKLDADIAVAGRTFRTSRAQGLKELQRLSREVQQLRPSLPGDLAKLMSGSSAKVAP